MYDLPNFIFSILHKNFRKNLCKIFFKNLLTKSLKYDIIVKFRGFAPLAEFNYKKRERKTALFI
nr:MAG TPA: hypothetical protein [Caudoviricetes sp.]